MSRVLRQVHGQALVFLLPLLAVLAAAAWWTFETGQAVTEKQRLRDAADASALSAAVWQARTLNFISTTNRAIVANEAVIAQSVSLRSWSSYMGRMLPAAAAITAYVPYLNAATSALQRWWTAFDRALQPSLVALEATTGAVERDLAMAARVMHAAAARVVPQVVHETVATIDPRFEVSAGGQAMLLSWAADWSRFASFYGGSWRWRQQDVVYRSLDGFTSQRNFTLSPLLGSRLLRFEKRGGTELLDFETWRGIDTLSLHQPRYVLFGSMRERVPLAWGGADDGAGSARRGDHGGAWRRNPRSSRAAESSILRQRAWLGLPSMYDLSVAQRARFQPPRIFVGLRLPASSRRGAAALLGFDRVARLAGDEVALGGPAGSGDLYAEAVASTMFERPERRRDGAEESPSLYSPYWRSSLVESTSVERVAVAAIDGTPVWLAAVPR